MYAQLLQLCPTLCNPVDHIPPGFSVHGIFQKRILEWVAISSSRLSSWPRDQTRLSYCRQILLPLSHCGSLLWIISHPFLPLYLLPLEYCDWAVALLLLFAVDYPAPRTVLESESERASHSVMSDSLRPHDYTVHGILQARILECVAFPFSRGSSQPRDWTQVSHIAGGFFTSWATRKAQEHWSGYPIPSPADLPDTGIKPGSPALQADYLPTELSGKHVLGINNAWHAANSWYVCI